MWVSNADFVWVALTLWAAPRRPFTTIREMVRPRLEEVSVIWGGGKLAERQRLHVGGVTDVCLTCRTADRSCKALLFLPLTFETLSQCPDVHMTRVTDACRCSAVNQPGSRICEVGNVHVFLQPP